MRTCCSASVGMMLRRLATTTALCLLLSGLVISGPSADAGGAPAAPPVKLATLDGLASAPDRDGQGARGRNTSVPTQTPIPFSLVGLTAPEGAEVELRTSVDGRAWSSWTAAEGAPDEGPDPSGTEQTRPASEPRWVGNARFVQTRVTGARPEDVTVHVIDSAGLSRPLPLRALDALRGAWSGGPAPAAAAIDQPRIVSRVEWQADESLNRVPPTSAPKARLGFVHHTVGANGYSAEEVPAILRGIHSYHVEVRGWDDIGYNLLVDRFGTVYEGRAGGLEAAVIGAHAGGFNTESFGVSLMGDYSTVAPEPEAVDALVRLLAWKFDVHHADVTSDVTVTSRGSTRFAEGQEVVLAGLSGHRDVSTTECPASLYQLLPELRRRVAEMQGPVLLDPSVSPAEIRVARGESLDGPLEFTTRLRPAGDWRLQVRAPDGTVVHSAAGTGEQARATWEAGDVRARGTYTATFSSAGRRPAVLPVSLVPPVIADPIAAPASVTAERSGELSEPVRFSAGLWPDARWSVRLTDPSGATVFTDEGVGEELSATWNGPAPVSGTYRWTIAADDVDPVEGTLDVADEVLKRVGDQSDPIDAAVDLSGTAFPLPMSATRAVVTRADVFADAMTAGPLAGADGPVLYTGREGLDPRVRQELLRVLPENGVVSVLGGPDALSDAVVQDLDRLWRVERLAGADRTDTAARVAESVVARTGARTALIARAGPDREKPWADALAGGAYGAARGLPVLLTDTPALSTAASVAIGRLGITDTIVLGGTHAISEDVFRALPRPVRIAGADRAGTAVEVARVLWGRTVGADGDRFLVADGFRPDSWTLALAATPLAAQEDAPLYVAGETALPAPTVDALRALGYGSGRRGGGYVLGTEQVVGPGPTSEAAALLQ